jgi:hypothetical protein
MAPCARAYGAPAILSPIAPALGILAMMLFLALLAGYAVKATTAFDAVKGAANESAFPPPVSAAASPRHDRSL